MQDVVNVRMNETYDASRRVDAPSTPGVRESRINET
jgi:hypothetical protein